MEGSSKHSQKGPSSPFLPQTKNYAIAIAAKQIAHLPLTIAADMPLSMSLLAHAVILGSDLLSQPTRKQLKQYIVDYGISTLAKKKLNLKKLGLPLLIAGGASFPYVKRLLSLDIPEFIQTNPHALSVFSISAFAFSASYHVSKLVYRSSDIIEATTKYFSQKNKLKQTFNAYIKPKDESSLMGKQIEIHNLMKTEPEKGFAALIKHRFDGGDVSAAKMKGMPIEYLLHIHRRNPNSLFLSSIMSYEIDEKIQREVFLKAKEKSMREKNYRMLSVLSLFDFIEQGSLKTSQEVLPLVYADSSLDEIVIGRGTTTQVTAKTTTDGTDSISLLYATKVSGDYTYFNQRKILTDYVGEEKPGSTSTIVDFVSHEDDHILHELQVRGVPYELIIGTDPKQLHHLLDFGFELSDIIEKGNFSFLENVDFIKKHENDLSLTQQAKKEIEILQKQTESYGMYVPIMDNHASQSMKYKGDVYLDITNKGKSHPMYDFATLFGFAFPYVAFDDLQRETKTGLKNMQERMNVEWNEVEEYFLRMYDSRRRRFIDTRIKQNNVGLWVEAQEMIQHSARVFSDYAEHSTQPKLARNFLEGTNDLKTLFS